MQNTCNYQGTHIEKESTSCNFPLFLLLEAERRSKSDLYMIEDSITILDIYEKNCFCQQTRKSYFRNNTILDQI